MENLEDMIIREQNILATNSLKVRADIKLFKQRIKE